MRVFHDLSIRYKLALLLLGVVSVVLLAVSIANVVCDVQNTRATLAAKYSTLAKIVAAQSGAALSIADVDNSGARQIVSDFEAEPAIHFAAFIDANGAEVARIHRTFQPNRRPPPPKTPGAEFTNDGFLDVVEEIKANDGARIGRIYLRASTDELRVQIRRTITIAIIVCVAALAVAFVLSIVLQRFVSEPILKLAHLTRRVSTEHDYSLCAASRGKDELGMLCDGFNSMLAEIRRRDDELQQFNDELLRFNEELRQFAFVASHDLQEPLRSITSFCNLLKEECQGQMDSRADDYVQRIVNGAKRMKNLVTDLLSYSRVSRDEQLAFDDVDFRVVARRHYGTSPRSTKYTPQSRSIGCRSSKETECSSFSCCKTWSATRSNITAIGRPVFTSQPEEAATIGNSPWRTTASASHPNTINKSLKSSSAFTAEISILARESAWPRARKSSSAMAAR